MTYMFILKCALKLVPKKYHIKVYFTCCLYNRKLLGNVSVGFNKMGQLLIIYFGFVRYGGGYNEAVHTKRKPMIQLHGRYCIIFLLSLVS